VCGTARAGFSIAGWEWEGGDGDGRKEGEEGGEGWVMVRVVDLGLGCGEVVYLFFYSGFMSLVLISLMAMKMEGGFRYQIHFGKDIVFIKKHITNLGL
jgi:hypothetical protein